MSWEEMVGHFLSESPAWGAFAVALWMLFKQIEKMDANAEKREDKYHMERAEYREDLKETLRKAENERTSILTMYENKITELVKSHRDEYRDLHKDTKMYMEKVGEALTANTNEMRMLAQKIEKD